MCGRSCEQGWQRTGKNTHDTVQSVFDVILFGHLVVLAEKEVRVFSDEFWGLGIGRTSSGIAIHKFSAGFVQTSHEPGFALETTRDSFYVLVVNRKKSVHICLGV
jgi:hypothetical protein